MSMPPASSERRPQDNLAAKPVTALTAVKDRVFHLMRPRGAKEIPPLLEGKTVGAGLIGPNETKIGELARSRSQITTVVDIACYETCIATVDQPLQYPGPPTFFGSEGFFNDMIEREASAVCVPSGFIQAGDTAALKAVRSALCDIPREDIVALFAMDVTWLRDDTINQVIAILQTVQHPIALSLAAQYNPIDKYVSVVRNLLRIYESCPHVGLWRTDVPTALDAMANGALFAGIGANGTLRHLVPPGERTAFGGGRLAPAVFLPELMHYFRASTLSQKWANAVPMTCACHTCGGRSLGRFDSKDRATEDEAHLHNLCCWIDLWGQMRRLRSEERRFWLARRMLEVALAYEQENVRIEQDRGFEPSKTLSAMIKRASVTLGSEPPVRRPAQRTTTRRR